MHELISVGASKAAGVESLVIYVATCLPVCVQTKIMRDCWDYAEATSGDLSMWFLVSPPAAIYSILALYFILARHSWPANRPAPARGAARPAAPRPYHPPTLVPLLPHPPRRYCRWWCRACRCCRSAQPTCAPSSWPCPSARSRSGSWSPWGWTRSTGTASVACCPTSRPVESRGGGSTERARAPTPRRHRRQGSARVSAAASEGASRAVPQTLNPKLKPSSFDSPLVAVDFAALLPARLRPGRKARALCRHSWKCMQSSCS